MRFYRSWQPVKAITFDLDDTFYDNHPYIRVAESKLREYLSQHIPQARDKDKTFWRKVRSDVICANPEFKNDMVLLRKTVLRKGLQQCGLIDGELEQTVESAYEHFYFHRSNFEVEPQIREVLCALAERYPLVAITNGNVDLEKIGIAPYFKLALHASVEQPMKPHPKMFQMAAEFLKLSPSDILHVGDNLEKDVGGALNMGFRAGWYAINRPMNINGELAGAIPDVEFSSLKELCDLLL